MSCIIIEFVIQFLWQLFTGHGCHGYTTTTTTTPTPILEVTIIIIILQIVGSKDIITIALRFLGGAAN